MDVTLTVETGRPLGSRHTRRLRNEGKVPGIVYGLGDDAVPIAVEWSELRKALTTDAGLNALITLDLDGQSELSLVKDLQRDPVKRSVTHVDFIRIDRDAEVEVEVPVNLIGSAELVEREDGTVAHLLFSLTVKAKPDAIPQGFEAEISELTIGDAIRVGDLEMPEGVRTEVDPEEVVALAQITRSTLEAQQAEEEALLAAELEGEGEEGEGESADEGDADASDDAGGGDDA